MAVINYNSNQTVQGTSNNDQIVGIEPAGNNNDIIYGHQGDDTITFNNALNNSTAYGGQGNDVMFGDNSDALYGNFGNDVIEVVGNTSTSIVASNDALYGGQGDDVLESFFGSFNVLYGNLGNDNLTMVNDTLQVGYGGQGNDFVEQDNSALGVEYGNQGNDVVSDFTGTGYNAAVNGSGAAEGSSVLYGGQGDDTLVADGAGGDTMYGGLGSDLFAANDHLTPFFGFTVNDMINVEDFVSGQDRLSLSSNYAAQTFSPSAPGFLIKDFDPAAANAADAESDANSFFIGHTAPEYVFVYGGAGAGYLFYNDDFISLLGDPTTMGMTLVGNNAEASLSANDIVASPFAS